MAFTSQRSQRGPRAPRAWFLRAAPLPLGVSTLGLAARSAAGCSPARRRQLHPGASRFGKPNRDRLFRAACAVLAFADVVHLFADKLARLRAGRFAFAAVPFSASQCFLFWHLSSSSISSGLNEIS